MNPGEYIDLVPRDIAANLEFRRAMIRHGSRSSSNAHDLWVMRARDPLFFINTFCFTYDPRKVPSAIPFVTWDFQDDTIKRLVDQVFGGRDLTIEKSRDMGASWLTILVLEHCWQFVDMFSGLLGSRKEEFVDKRGDPKSLFWKIDFLLQHQPGWLLPTFHRKKMHLRNEDNGSTLDGESTNEDFARGDRRTVVVLDEFAAVDNGVQILAATADVTRCRVFCSTPKGTGNAFYDKAVDGTDKLRLHWTLHPEKAAGLYHDADGKPRSPWYDRECERRKHPVEIAQELDIDYLGADYQFFSSGVLDAHQKEYCRAPFLIGNLDYTIDSAEPTEFVELGDGPLQLWCHLDGAGLPSRATDYSMGVDIAVGTGASNSVVTIADKTTGRKIAQYTNAHLRPDELAMVAVALARFFKGSRGNGAFMVWESNGPGRAFGNKVIELGYRNFYYRETETKLRAVRTDTPGFASSKESKRVLLEEYRAALTSATFINPSYESLQEARQYIYSNSGTIEHSRAKNSVDPSGAKDNHGDRVIADALAFRGMRKSAPVQMIKDKRIPMGSLAHRRKMRQRNRTPEYSR